MPPPPTEALPRGKLEWPLLLGWLREDGWISADDAEPRHGALSAPALPACTRWCAWAVPAWCTSAAAGAGHRSADRMAGRPRHLAYLRIDPLRVDVGRVADVMSVQYAQSRTPCR
jgi:general secretion pathway protein E